MAAEIEYDPERLQELIAHARVVLWDFDGPICRLFAGHSSEDVADRIVAWLGTRGLSGLLTEEEREWADPQAILRVVDRRHPGSDLVAEMEKRLTDEELHAAPTAMPTAWADPLIRTWKAVGAGLAITTNNSPQVVRSYLSTRGLDSCFTPHIYGRTQVLEHLKPHPHCLNRALSAMGAAPSAALMIGDAPTDLAAARLAGVPFLGYASSERKAKLLKDAGAENVLGSLEPLLGLLRR
ncbi:HAD family hydrolase [Streptomyces sp. NPDC002499]